MNEEISKLPVGEDKNWDLPQPEYPKLEMPEHPKAGVPIDGKHLACDGEQRPSVDLNANTMISPPEPGMLRIMIGIPILSYSHEFVQSFLKFWTEACTQAAGKMQIGYHFMHRRPVHMAEIELAEIALFNKCTHLLLMDDDIYDITLADLNKLIAADKDVVGGLMYASGFPYAMCAFRRFDAEKKVIDMPSDNSMYRLYEVPCACNTCGYGLSHWDALYCPACGAAQSNMIQKVDLLPFPFTLIKTSVFPKLKKPWFHCEIEYPSDSWFCDRCHEAGIEVYAHMGVRLNHRGITDLTRHYYFEMEIAKKQAVKSPGLVHLSDEDMKRHQYLLDKKMKEAELKCKTKVIFTDGPAKEESHDGKTQSISDVVPEKESVEVPG